MGNIAIKHLQTHMPSKRKKSRWKAWLLLFLLLIIAGGIIYLVHMPAYQIKNIEVKGAVLTDESKIKEIAEQSISGTYFYIIPKKFIYTYPSLEVKSQIERTPSIMEATLNTDTNTQTLNISLREREQKYLWCGQAMPSDAASSTDDLSKAQDKCFYMDKSGLIFVEAPPLEGNVFLKFSGLVGENPIGQNFLKAEDMASLLAFIDGIKALGLLPKSVKAVSLVEIHITLQTGGDIIVSLDKSLTDVLHNLTILLASKDWNDVSGGIGKIHYIDLRYGSKAFWK
jgi:cell division septal protein FtsQ